MELWARLKLDYKRHCYEQAVRRRPRLPEVVQPPPPVDVTTSGDSTRGEPVPSAATLAETARPYRESATAAYRDGDFAKALIDFDLAIWLDPNFEDAYINRGIILYRMGEFDFAFDDVVHALHIESSHRIEHPPLPKPSPLLNKDYKGAP